MSWNTRHGEVLIELLRTFNEENIKYFILRNYEGLPEINTSKDVDIVVDPLSFKQSIKIIKDTFRKFKITYYYEVSFTNVYCCHGIDVKTKFSIHIDLIFSYVTKGFEIFTFEELYNQTDIYKDFRVLNKYYEGVMVFIYKQFGYGNPILKEAYKEIIYNTYINFPEFKKLISKLAGSVLAVKIFSEIENKNFDKMISHSSSLTGSLKKYAFYKNPIKTLINVIKFYLEKSKRIIFQFNNFSKVFSVMAPDGAGKTTFLDALIDKLEFYFVNDKKDNRFNIYHFRPNILPNLGELAEKAKIKEQDKDFSNPHRAKPASFFSSLFRITYYWLDYVLGYNIKVRKDVQYDRFSVFDRYSYDLIVDPKRTKLNLPLWLRKIYVYCMPQPKIVFYLDADAEVIYNRKQELTLDEINRQNIEYRNLASSNKRFVILNSNRPVNESVNEAVDVILNTFTDKL